MDSFILIVITYIIIAIVLILFALFCIKRRKIKNCRRELEELDKEKNEIESAPVISELTKLETIIKNDKIEEKYKKWVETFESIKHTDVSKINDMIIDLDALLDRKDLKEYDESVAKLELEIYKARTATDNLLDEIKDINIY